MKKTWITVRFCINDFYNQMNKQISWTHINLMGNKRTSLKSGVFYSLLYIITASSLALATIWFINEKRNLGNRSAQLTETYEKRQKEYLVEEVNKALTIIKTIKDYNVNVNDEIVKDEILTVLADVRLRYEGYLFVNQYDGKALLFDGKKTEGL